MHQIIAEHEQLQKKKYRFQSIGSGGGIPDYVTNFTICYASSYQVDIEEARTMLVNNVEDLLCLINSNEEIKPYLSNFPFTINNLDIGIAFVDEIGKMLEPPYLAYVFLINEKIFYSFYDQTSQKFIGKNYSESYVEARRIVLGE